MSNLLTSKFFKLPFYRGDLGLELEVEAKQPLPTNGDIGRLQNMWYAKREGSLRGYNMEYITQGNIFNNPNKTKHINWLIDTLKPYQPIPDSPRTSLHVHVNVQRYTLNQVYACMVGYWLLENLLTKFCGPTREGNHFCLRACDAEWIVRKQVEAVSQHGYPFYSEVHNKNLRYSGLNTAAVPRFGSLEVRSMRGVMEPKIIDMWSSELQRMFSRIKTKFNNPSALMDTYFAFSKEQFINLLFSKAFVKELKTIKGWEGLIEENEGLVCSLAYCVNWDSWEPMTTAPKTKKTYADLVNMERQRQQERRWHERAMQIAGVVEQVDAVREPAQRVVFNQPNDWVWGR